MKCELRVLWRLCISVIALFGAATSAANETWELSGKTMGTYYSVVLADRVSPAVRSHIEVAVSHRLAYLESLLSTYRNDSAISVFNRTHSLAWQRVPREIYELTARSRELYDETQGYFDPSIGALIELWGFGVQPFVDPFAIEQRIQRVKRAGSMDLVEFDDLPGYRLRKRHAELQLNFSAIAKGYAVDSIAAILDATTARHYLIDIGGDLRTRGRRGAGEPWKIAVQSPLSGAAAVAVEFTAENIAVATSGNYRNVREVSGRLVGHIIDPHTGSPVEHNLLSVTVMAVSATRADALATALFAMGGQAGIGWSIEHEVDAYFLLADGDNWRAIGSGVFAGLAAD